MHRDRYIRSPKSHVLTVALMGLFLMSGFGVASSPGSKSDNSSLPKVEFDPNADPIRIAFISYANPQQVASDSEAVCRYLEPFVGVPVKGFVTMDYGSSVEAMRNEQADLAFVDPLAFMMAHEQIGVKPLVLEIYASGEPTYYSCIWVRKDSGIRELKDMKDKVISFADQVDMSGHLMPRDIFVREGLLPKDQLEGSFFKQVYFAGGDEQAIRAVYNGFVDAAGISQFAYLLLRPEEREEITVIARSIDSPSHLVMARKNLSDETCERISQALLSLDPKNPTEKMLLDRLYGVQGFAEAKMSDFADVAKIAARYGFIRKPEAFAKPSSESATQETEEDQQ
ncbi:MAG: phosphate/phosphite/phosphonate ABC transporter substrate-binding protein [Planctomycetota bacterium]|nr:phosphate/phosphite/phosphonate ABC transporter substrate-binding protein [Planctomycetota bacterium]